MVRACVRACVRTAEWACTLIVFRCDILHYFAAYSARSTLYCVLAETNVHFVIVAKTGMDHKYNDKYDGISDSGGHVCYLDTFSF